MWLCSVNLFRKYFKLFADLTVFTITVDYLLLGGHDIVEKHKYIKILTRLNRRPDLL